MELEYQLLQAENKVLKEQLQRAQELANFLLNKPTASQRGYEDLLKQSQIDAQAKQASKPKEPTK